MEEPPQPYIEAPIYVDNYVDDGYNDAAFGGWGPEPPEEPPMVDNYVWESYEAEAWGDYGGLTGDAMPDDYDSFDDYDPAEDPVAYEGSWDWMHDEAMDAMYGHMQLVPGTPAYQNAG